MATFSEKIVTLEQELEKIGNEKTAIFQELQSVKHDFSDLLKTNDEKISTIRELSKTCNFQQKEV